MRVSIMLYVKSAFLSSFIFKMEQKWRRARRHNRKTIANKGVLKYMKLGIGTRCQDFITFYILIILHLLQYHSVFITYSTHISLPKSTQVPAFVV